MEEANPLETEGALLCGQIIEKASMLLRVAIINNEFGTSVEQNNRFMWFLCICATMKVFISCDMEGISGIVHIDQTHTDGQDYPRCRQLMTAEVNAAALGAFEAGAEEVLVNDSHGDMRNIIIEKLDPRAQLISGSLKPLSMVQGIEQGFNAAFFIGYHAGAGAQAGVLDHTYYGAVVSQVRVNEARLNELGLNALVAGYYRTPVALISGDERICQEAKKLVPNIVTVPVKWGVTRYAARSLHPVEAQKRIHEAAKKALTNVSQFRPISMKSPYTLQIRMHNSGLADGAETMPGAVRTDPVTIEYKTDDIMVMFKGLITLVTLAGSSIPKVRNK
jgi:D-amino peptidase